MPTPTFLVCPDVVKFENVGQIAVVNGMVYLGGSVGIDKSGTLHKGLEEQTRQTFDNIRKCLEYANSGLTISFRSTSSCPRLSATVRRPASTSSTARSSACQPRAPAAAASGPSCRRGLVEVVNVVAAQK